MTPSLNTTALLAGLSTLVGHHVTLRSVRRPACEVVWLIAPEDCTLRTIPFWRAVQASPGAGIYAGPEKASVGFASGVATCRQGGGPEARQGLEKGLRALLINGPVPVAVLMPAFKRLGLSPDQVERAGRRIGVVRKKAGMQSGWTWSLPLEVSVQDIGASREGRNLKSGAQRS